MATVYFTASSLDGFIVDEANSLDWLTSRAIDVNGPFGYQAFNTGVGALVMGSATYEWLLVNQPGEWMYDQPTWVLTSRPHIIADGHPVTVFEGAVTDLHPRLVEAAGEKDVRIGGGASTLRDFLAADLVDWMHVVQVPTLLGRGVRLWDGLEGLEERYDVETVASPSGVTHLTFTRAKS